MTKHQRHRFIATLLPAIQIHAACHWSKDDPESREEKTAAATASAWKMFVSACKRKKDAEVHPASLSRFAAMATDDGREISGSAPSDVLARHHTAVESLDRTTLVEDSQCGYISEPVGHTLIDGRTWEHPYDATRIKLDWKAAEQSGLLSSRALDAFRLFAQQYKPSEVAKALGISPARVSQIKDEIGEALVEFFGPSVVPA